MQVSRTLQLISIQHELSMHIGLDLSLEKMLDIFMQRALQRLSLSGIKVFYKMPSSDGNEVQACISYPNESIEDQTWLTNKSELWCRSESGMYSEYNEQQELHYLFVIPEFGSLVLERQHNPIEPMILQALSPLLNKLATSCKACLEHQKLLDEICARKKAEHSLIQQSLLDPLTGLANRKMFNLSLHQALSSNASTKTFGAIFFMDVDRFKIINDSFGHAVGDQVLIAISERLASCGNENAILARMGGDEFVLLISQVSTDMPSTINRCEEIAKAIAESLAVPLSIDGHLISASVSVGISLFPLDESVQLSNEQQANLLIRNADLAMYRIKHTHRNGYRFFSSDLQAFSEKSTQVEQHLRMAVDNNELSINYQPLVDNQGNIIAAEALLRWNNPELGQVSPAEFIPIAEESGLVIKLGQWVLEQVCILINKLPLNQGGANALRYISVNVSPRQFNQANFVQSFLDVLNKYQTNKQLIRVEITENVALEDVELAITKIQQLKAHGIDCMLDDFGSGYSSLSYLNRLPLKTIKIDRSFVNKIDQSKYHQLIVHAVSNICDYSDLECIAEGVENQGEYQYLVSQNVNIFQGYHFYKPMTETEFLSLVTVSFS